MLREKFKTTNLYNFINKKSKLAKLVTISVLLISLFVTGYVIAADKPTLSWGSSGDYVKQVQRKLSGWGYYSGQIDGQFGTSTSKAVKLFQKRNGLKADGVVGPGTWKALGFSTAATSSGSSSRNSTVELLARAVAAEATGEPYQGQVAVAAVMLNRAKNSGFPNTVSDVIFQPHALESVTNGLFWRRTPSQTAYKAARDALNGFDPTYGCVFFWNPSKPVSSWIWSRKVVVKIGNHVFAK